ncbi:MAG: L-aspartate oxidase [Acidobacteriota bacterium]|nr:L-aspartate oxidase [Blastocatellia bacterium]MDW8412491.1 L-aspartate oxidase [Acidobacteriota bacterium]
MSSNQTDYIVIGSGIAGLRAAIGLAEAGAEVTVLTKDRISESNTEYAQGGIAVALSDDDEVALHFHDTIAAGAELCDEAAVKVLVEEGPKYITELIDWGTQFDREGNRLVFTKEAAHSRNRILHAQGDSTGREIVRSLLAVARRSKQIHMLAHAITLDLLLKDGEAVGVRFIDQQQRKLIYARAVILATGGGGQLYSHTTNPDVATGDGIAMAYHAGAAIYDMEFVQFHPTALCIPDAPRFLISEAVRGEGGYLLNRAGKRFMQKYDPRGELAPRDIVSRAIVSEMSESASNVVYLDMTHLPSKFLRERFPKIFETCLTYGYDITKDYIPVSPAAHYLMGGVRTDLWGRTSVPRLYAAGEVASTGVHGANRLASNSLLEGLVFGARAAQAALSDKLSLPQPRHELSSDEEGLLPKEHIDPEIKHRVKQIMWRYVGICRSAHGLQTAHNELSLLAEQARNTATANFVTVANLITEAALFRTESRGGHYRTDFPEKDNERWRVHTVQKLGREISTAPLQTL